MSLEGFRRQICGIGGESRGRPRWKVVGFSEKIVGN